MYHYNMSCVYIGVLFLYVMVLHIICVMILYVMVCKECVG